MDRDLDSDNPQNITNTTELFISGNSNLKNEEQVQDNLPLDDNRYSEDHQAISISSNPYQMPITTHGSDILISTLTPRAIFPDSELSPKFQEPESLLVNSRNIAIQDGSRSPSPMPVIISSSNSQKLDGDDFTAKSNQM